MKTFGTLEYVLDKYSGTWAWKVTGARAVMMASKIIQETWYGDGPNEAIVPDNPNNIKHLKWIMDSYPLEILSKSIWQRKITPKILSKPIQTKTEKLSKVTPAKQFRGKLLNFQKEGLDFLLKSTGNALLADEMGLGKTVQTLAYIASEKQSSPTLVIAPLVTLNNWQREIGKFMKKKSRNGRIIEDGIPTSTMIRKGKQEPLGDFDFYIINYEMLRKRFNDLSKLNIRTLVCDEVQHLRSKTTQKYAAVKKIAAMKSVKYRVGLSGTPIYNRGSEIWPIVDILKPGLLGNFKEFCEYFCYLDEKGKAIVVPSKRNGLRHLLTDHIMLRRKKSDVLKELKAKVRYTEIIDADANYYQDELNKIEQKSFSNERLERVKDIFLFSCYTGYAPVDAQGLTKDNLIKNNDGDLWIKANRAKTGTRANVPVLPTTKFIIDKYDGRQKGLIPKLSNQKMNAYLKEIADVCGINKHLTWYVARHTFATTVTLGNGISLENVSAMLGHSSIRQTQHYAKVLDSSVMNDMKKLFDKYC